ncbi:MAG: HypC/HybG/HupF family hydrogenase formation chaperone [Candidatus Omnitrophica bacterium]|nr:HypC/HybG/HupF family hydrogenase formation chaperone [Candidatus Omnitrophota bacterium]MBU1996973.1 HypC/HybG/HupF family hydrogenase formation chaperone [Candidatus Omnitrophota bacterium]MBU4334393.1 HypC/HybG/HupF family hydrogenase formation chaperone [Candidatus Omnitrophota bacterium]
MCLAAPGKIEEIIGVDPLNKIGKVNFGGVVKDINLSYVPEAKVNDYVIAHVGFALNTIDEVEAEKLLEDIKMIEGFAEDDWEGDKLQ